MGKEQLKTASLRLDMDLDYQGNSKVLIKFPNKLFHYIKK